MNTGELNNKIKVIKILCNKLQDNGSLGIDIGHMSENVRVNGWQRKVSLIDIYRETKELKNKVSKNKKTILEDEKIIVKILELLKDYKICPKCKGNQGIHYNEKHLGQEWEDCQNCNGIGMIKI